MIVVLNKIRSKYNVGSIFRTADGCGVEKIYLCGYTPAPVDHNGEPNTQLLKVSLGAEQFVDWEKPAQSIEDLLNQLKVDGYRIFLVEQSENSISYDKVAVSSDDKVVLVLGNEIDGLPVELEVLADAVLEIPMRGGKTSLNVSVAFGIVAYSLCQVVKG